MADGDRFQGHRQKIEEEQKKGNNKTLKYDSADLGARTVRKIDMQSKKQNKKKNNSWQYYRVKCNELYKVKVF